MANTKGSFLLPALESIAIRFEDFSAPDSNFPSSTPRVPFLEEPLYPKLNEIIQSRMQNLVIIDHKTVPITKLKVFRIELPEDYREEMGILSGILSDHLPASPNLVTISLY